MQDDEKDKYEELDELDDLNNVEELQELPVEAVPEPLGDVTEPMDSVQQQLADEKSQESSPPEEPKSEDSRTDLGKKIEALAKVRDASEYLRGQKQVKVIKKSAIKAIIDEIIQQYSGVEHKDLLSKIAEYEMSISNLREQNEQLKKLEQSFQEEIALKYEKEVEDLRNRLNSAEELLKQDSSRENAAKLEKEVLELRERVKQLESGLEYAAVVEEFDYGMAMEISQEQGQQIQELKNLIEGSLESESENKRLVLFKELVELIEKRNSFLSEIFRESSVFYSDALKKVDNTEGSVEAVAQAVRLNAKNNGWYRELETYGRLIEVVDTAVRAK